jgi:site-specific DNA-methyltransferase (adenine-specific)
VTAINSYVTPSTRYDWGTPDSVFAPLHEEFGFTLDVCASQWNAKCQRYWTADDDALSRPWAMETCWMNPPYGRQIAAWMRKACEEASCPGGQTTVVCLVPARTDTAWWHDYAMRGEVRFIRGRIRFVRPDCKDADAPFPSAIVVFRPHSAEGLSAPGGTE